MSAVNVFILRIAGNPLDPSPHRAAYLTVVSAGQALSPGLHEHGG